MTGFTPESVKLPRSSVNPSPLDRRSMIRPKRDTFGANHVCQHYAAAVVHAW
jgi:hypothetical protein